MTTILSMPPPRVLYQGQKVGTEAVGVPALPPGRSTLQPPQRGGWGHERKGSGDRRSRGGETTEKGEALPQLCNYFLCFFSIIFMRGTRLKVFCGKKLFPAFFTTPCNGSAVTYPRPFRLPQRSTYQDRGALSGDRLLWSCVQGQV